MRTGVVRLRVRSGPVGIALFAPDSRMHYANAALCEMLGYTRDEFVAAPFDALLLHPEGRARETARRQQVLAGEQYDCELSYLRRDGLLYGANSLAHWYRRRLAGPRFIAHLQALNENMSCPAERGIRLRSSPFSNLWR